MTHTGDEYDRQRYPIEVDEHEHFEQVQVRFAEKRINIMQIKIVVSQLILADYDGILSF